MVGRLKRAWGNLAHVIGMLEAEEPCLGIVRQLHAVEEAVTNAKRAFIGDHIDHCLAPEDAGDISELKTITRYLGIRQPARTGDSMAFLNPPHSPLRRRIGGPA